ncbi:MAG: ABC transporter substrate-binding protein [Actinobacteria bacterium]|nr:ABC transporter substrate-binding protein [Actinomycetota bacterium]
MVLNRGSRTASLTRLIGVLVLAAAFAALAGCGDKKDSGTTGPTGATGAAGSGEITAQKDEAVARLVPAEIANRGKLVVAMDASYPPNEFFDKDGKTIIGMDPDYAKVIGQTMGLEVELKNVTFDAILPGLAAGKYDLAMSSFTDTKEREKTVDMVTYLIAGTKFYTAADKPTEISGLEDLCGKTVAVEKGTTQADDAEAQSKKCEKAGSDPVKVSVFPDQSGANLALTSGRAQIGMADSPVAAYIIDQSDGKLKATGEDYGTAPYGIAVNKDSGLTEAVLAAVKATISGGQYVKVLEKWNLADGSIDEAKINDGVE